VVVDVRQVAVDAALSVIVVDVVLVVAVQAVVLRVA